MAMLTRFVHLVLITFSLGLASAGPVWALFGSSGPDPAIVKTQEMVAELKQRTGVVWDQIDKQVDLLLKFHGALNSLSVDQVNGLSEQDLEKQMALHLEWAKKFEELRDFLADEYGLFIEKAKSAEMNPVFKEGIIKHYDTVFRDAAREDMYPYLNGMEGVNQSLFETFSMIRQVRFPGKETGEQEKPLDDETLKVLRGAVPKEALEKFGAHRRAFGKFIEDFRFNPLEDSAVYKAGQMFFARDEKVRNELELNFAKGYFKNGLAAAEYNMKFYLANALNNELSGVLPASSGEALMAFARSDLDAVKRLALNNVGGDTKGCLFFSEGKSFVGVDFGQITSKIYGHDGLWSLSDFFRSANDAIVSAKTAPGAFSQPREKIEPVLEIGKKSAATKIKGSSLYKKFMKNNKFSPRRYCFLRVALLDELLKLPSPSREDALRLLYTQDLEKRLANAATAASK